MILPNNPRIDADEVNVRVASVAARRRRPEIAAAGPQPAPRDETEGGDAVDAGESIHAPAPADGLSNAALPGDDHAGSSPAPPTGAWRARLKKLPLVGGLGAFVRALVRLPRFRRDVVEVHEILRAELRGLREAQTHLRSAHAEMADLQSQRIQRLESRCSLLETRLASQHRAVRLLEHTLDAAGRSSGETTSASGAALSVGIDTSEQAPVQSGALGNFYAEFEARFRGARESVKSRQRQYLDYVRQATAGRPAARCVDIGCGRGEWLELLTEEGFAPVGLDIDAGMVLEARQAGLDARIGDGIAWLERQPEASVDVISAFQVIEHLPFQRLVRLLDAALRALAPDGVAIFETPNPENLLVATNSFHLDPTHLRPIPPQLVEFLAQQRGFARAEILRMNALPAEMHVAGEGELTLRVNQLLYGAQDYALIAWKRGADAAN